MKKTYKRLFKNAFFRSLIVWLAANFIRLVYYTNRLRLEVDDASRPYVHGEKQAMYAFWHGRMMMIPMIRPPKRKMNVLISSHRDGEMIARTMHQLGFDTVRGSTSRGGATAGREAVKALQDGENVAITPDGPRGPIHSVQKGVIAIAEMAGVPVIPVVFSASRNRRARSWDRFMVALPFGRLYYKIGAPMWNATPEMVGAALMALNDEADQYVRIIS